MSAREDKSPDRLTVQRNVALWRRTHRIHPTTTEQATARYFALRRDIRRGRMVSLYENWPVNP